ncbi:Tankyrase-2 [Dactylella cylindrospora]|nr:Tankyrase-2 [Dactylella cylindrospora]
MGSIQLNSKAEEFLRRHSAAISAKMELEEYYLMSETAKNEWPLTNPTEFQKQLEDCLETLSPKYLTHLLCLAVQEQRPYIVRILLSHGAQPLPRGITLSLLVTGPYRGLKASSKMIIQDFANHGYDVSTMEIDHYLSDIPLLAALMPPYSSGYFQNAMDMCKWALEWVKNPYPIRTSGDHDPLICAISWVNVELVEMFIKLGREVSAHYLIEAASLHGHRDGRIREIIKILLDYGADINAHDERENTPLHMAAAEGSVIAIKTLLSHGADRYVKDRNGKIPADRLLTRLETRKKRAGTSVNRRLIEQLEEAYQLLL